MLKRQRYGFITWVLIVLFLAELGKVLFEMVSDCLVKLILLHYKPLNSYCQCQIIPEAEKGEVANLGEYGK